MSFQNRDEGLRPPRLDLNVAGPKEFNGRIVKRRQVSRSSWFGGRISVVVFGCMQHMTGPIKLPAFFELPPHQGLLGKLEMLNARQLQDISTLMPVANGLRRCGKSCDKGRFRTMQIEAKAKDHKLANRVAAQFIVEGGNKHGIQTVSGFWLHLTKEDTCKLTLVSTARLCLPARSGWMDLWHVLIVRKSAPASLRRLEVDIAKRVAPIIARLRRMPTTARITGGSNRGRLDEDRRSYGILNSYLIDHPYLVAGIAVTLPTGSLDGPVAP
ncbi:hypothetical protein DFH06DRAFT_1124041 [Mycena polygramma]|nr:hypothetical protein DFH06DRAFT_1124041 [Mycena polygramma]